MFEFEMDSLSVARIFAPLMLLWGGYFITNPERATAGQSSSHDLSALDPTGKALAVFVFLAGLALIEFSRSWTGDESQSNWVPIIVFGA
ncbi:MAG: hypothetical protein CMF75_06410, partial [Maricaulis sp.]|nr:hypothetical protein [Maricaulis sp.]